MRQAHFVLLAIGLGELHVAAATVADVVVQDGDDRSAAGLVHSRSWGAATAAAPACTTWRGAVSMDIMGDNAAAEATTAAKATSTKL